MFEQFKKQIKKRWQSSEVKHNEVSKQKMFIISVALILAFLIWLVVNLNQSYTVNVNVPLKLGEISADRALTEKLPKNVTVRISGEGWNLLSIYQNPPSIPIEVSNEQINLFDQVRRQLQANTKLRVQSVDPLYLNLQLKKKVVKKVPIRSNVEVKFDDQFGFLGSPHLQPDSVTVGGAQAVIENINYWVTDSLMLTGVSENISLEIALKNTGPLVTLSQKSTQFTATVTQFTEGEVTIPVELRNAIVQRNVIFSPQEVTITYLAPIHAYPNLDEKSMFAVYVTYSQLMRDTTGFISPNVAQTSKEIHLKIQQVQPRQVAYFNVLATNK